MTRLACTVSTYLFGMIMWVTAVAELASAAPCPIAQSVYRDAEGKGFELVFGEPLPNSVTSATATITYPQAGEVYSFTVGQSQGYGTIYMGLIEDEPFFTVNFFDQNLISANPLWLGEETQAPKYIFMTGLGSYDYYFRRHEIYSYELSPVAPLLGEIMWVYHRCQADEYQEQDSFDQS